MDDKATDDERRYFQDAGVLLNLEEVRNGEDQRKLGRINEQLPYTYGFWPSTVSHFRNLIGDACAQVWSPMKSTNAVILAVSGATSNIARGDGGDFGPLNPVHSLKFMFLESDLVEPMPRDLSRGGLGLVRDARIKYRVVRFENSIAKLLYRTLGSLILSASWTIGTRVDPIH